MGVDNRGEGGVTPNKGVCCKEWVVTINPVKTLENSTIIALHAYDKHVCYPASTVFTPK